MNFLTKFPKLTIFNALTIGLTQIKEIFGISMQKVGISTF